MSQAYMSQIEAFGFPFAPRGWMQCAGQLLPIAQYQALFSLLGTTYGGNGVSTFGLPDLRGRASMSYGTGPGGTQIAQGQSSGQETNTLTQATVPAHSHTISAVNTAGATTSLVPDATTSSGVGNKTGIPFAIYNTTTTGLTPLAPTGPSGGNAAHTNLMPFTVVNYCIAIQGIFPSRG